ncbi:MAG: S41 family peptidase, partial [Phycisphaerales bacterium]|nr:S41 family peptidase [Phycisphaerales bacterium]
MFHGGERNQSPKTTVLLGVLFCAIVFAFGYSIGSTTRIDELRWGGSSEGETPADVASEVDFSAFWDVWDLVSEEYIDQPVDKQSMLDGAIEGMVAALGDPYTTYFTPELAEEFRQEVDQKFFGIGAEIGERDGTIVVIAPLPDTPASGAGVRAEDFILAIDGEDTAGMTVEEAVRRIRGDEGTDVTLTLLRNGEEPLDVTITRAEITVDSVRWELRDDGIAVVTISVFNEDTVRLFQEAVDAIVPQDPTGIVIDLRNDPGGLLNAAIDVASFWTGSDVVVIEASREGQEAYGGDASPVLLGIPTVALVN